MNMKLETEDAGLFYELFMPLLDYVNERFNITAEKVKFTGKSVNPRDAAEVANFLWKRTSIIDDYVAATKIADENKEILMGWKRCIQGTYIIERHLKKGSVFISADDNSVYLVNGIIDSWEEMLSYYSIPIALKATLLPFKNVIISDGLVSVIPVCFGKNYKADFKDTYMTAKLNHSIITHI